MSLHPRHLAPAILGLLFTLSGCSTLPTEDPRIAALRNQTVIESPIRTDQDRRMDAARHPAEFLPFTQVKPGMQVLDVSTGAGYTSQLLALASARPARFGRSANSRARRSPSASPTIRRPISSR